MVRERRKLTLFIAAAAAVAPLVFAFAQQPGEEVKSYLSNLYIWFLGFVGIAALFAIVMGGVLYMFSSSVTSTEQAKTWIKNAIFGILIAAGSVLLLSTINPDLAGGFDIQAIINRGRQKLP